MKCPRCEESVLEERERDGVTIDGCKTCRGVWLDRGELERLIARVTRDFDDLERSYGERPGDARYRAERERDGERGPWDRDHRGYGYPHRKKRWLDKLGDIFD